LFAAKRKKFSNIIFPAGEKQPRPPEKQAQKAKARCRLCCNDDRRERHGRRTGKKNQRRKLGGQNRRKFSGEDSLWKFGGLHGLLFEGKKCVLRARADFAPSVLLRVRKKDLSGKEKVSHLQTNNRKNNKKHCAVKFVEIDFP